MKKLLIALLVMALVLTLMAPAMALTDTVPDGWTPIYTPEDLDGIRNDLDANYILMNDIDMSGWGNWEPIGAMEDFFSGVWFSGTLDGNGYEIQNLKIDYDEVNLLSRDVIFAGLFAVLGGTVKSLGIVNVSIRAGFDSEVEGVSAGGIAGLGAWCQVENCYVTGEIAVYGERKVIASGLIGADGDGAGSGTIRNCYTVVELTAVQGSELCEVNGITVVGALDGLIENCYSNIDPIVVCYYNMELMPVDATNVEVLTLTQMTHAANFAGFDFTDEPIWYIKEGETYPKLRPFPAPESPTYFPDPGTGVEAETDDDVFPPGTVMTVTELGAGNFVLGPGNSVHAVYDIKFVKDNEVVQPDGKVTVRLPFKDVSPGTSANWKVYYVERDIQGNITNKVNMNARVVQIGGVYYWEFEADHFSLYAVVDEAAPPNIDPAPPHFWDTWPCWAQWILKWLLFGWVWMRWF